ncbi:hypothetical protein [Caulobacter sp. Root1455]|uniref:hypothetical protein n=1 Tax=Caulobacter sp. Root1455 TaxID=1736465 RepID=UPI000B136856|nr:hypothetical protein [Caulobacter sp. Root1455]
MKQITPPELSALPTGIADAIGFLRRSGFSKVEIMRVLVESRGLSIPEAKLQVHAREHWDDVRDRDDRFHDDLIAVATAVDEAPG